MTEIFLAVVAMGLIGGGAYLATRNQSGGGSPAAGGSAEPDDVENGFRFSNLFSGFASSQSVEPPRPGFSLRDFFTGIEGVIETPGPVSSDPYASYRNLSHDEQVLAWTLWGEARGEGERGIHAVANVIMNRVADRRWPGSAAAVCLQPWQFSMWNANDHNGDLAKAQTPEGSAIYRTCIDIAKAAVSGVLADITGGSNHYHTKAVDPSWNRNMREVASIGAHRFFVG